MLEDNVANREKVPLIAGGKVSECANVFVCNVFI